MTRKNIILAILLLGSLAGTGFVVKSAFHEPPAQKPGVIPEGIKNPKIPDIASTGSSSAANKNSSQTAAKEPVQKFVMAVAGPSKPAPTADDKKKALSYLTPELANKVAVSYGNDPGKLLGIPRPISFLVRDGTGDTKSQEVRVIFKVASGPDLTVYFSVRADNHGRWLISSIQKNAPSPSLPR